MNRNEKPTYDFFEEEPLSDYYLEEILNNFVFYLETGYFSMWESVVAAEENKKLTKDQEGQLNQLINFGEEEMEEILYIDESPRPSKPWYETAREIAKRLFQGQIKTYEVNSTLAYEGWDKLKEAIIKYGENLSQPKGIENPIEIIPEELRHKLEIQTAIDWLVGLGQEEELTLADPAQHFRIKELVEELKKKISSVRYLKLSIEKIAKEFVELSATEKIKFEEAMIKKIGLANVKEEMTEKLENIVPKK